MKVAIIGAGWFGGHLGVSLLAEHEVVVFERGSAFGGASGNNQNRLHLGYHYPRSAKTRREIALTHEKFRETYPTRIVEDNLFGVSETSSIDLGTYSAIMQSERLPLERHSAASFGLKGLEADTVFRTKELVIDTPAAKQMFEERLRPFLRLNTTAVIEQLKDSLFVNGEPFSAAIDCTSGELHPNNLIFFEPAVMAEYEGPVDHFALTVMDGQFPCLYPASPGLWRVSHVLHTARGSFANFAQADEVLRTLKADEIVPKMTEALSEFYPAFAQLFKPTGRLIKAVRTKLKNNNASREYRIDKAGRLLRVFSGKICSVFLVEQEVRKWLETLS